MSITRFLKYISLYCCCLFSGYGLAQSLLQTQLDNGLTVVVQENHRSPLVFTSIWYRVGGGNEVDGSTGVAHMLEHMMFKGTAQYPGNGFSEKIIANGGTLNAMTGPDYTMYYEVLPSDRWPISLALEADRMHNLQFDAQAFAKEHAVVQEERRMRVEDNPIGTMFERLSAAVFVNGPYHHPVIGWPSDLRHLTLDDAKQWYQQWYGPNNAILVIVGDVDSQHVVTLVKKYFLPIPSRVLPAVKPQQLISPLGATHMALQIKAELPRVIIGFSAPSAYTGPASTAASLAVLSAALGLGDSSQLNQALVQKKQLATTAGSSYNPQSRRDSLFYVYATPAKKGLIDSCQRALMRQIQIRQRDKLTQQALSRIKTQLIAAQTYANDQLSNQAQRLGTALVAQQTPRSLAQSIAQISQVTADQVRDVARQWLTPKHAVTATLTPLSS